MTEGEVYVRVGFGYEEPVVEIRVPVAVVVRAEIHTIVREALLLAADVYDAEAQSS